MLRSSAHTKAQKHHTRRHQNALLGNDRHTDTAIQPTPTSTTRLPVDWLKSEFCRNEIIAMRCSRFTTKRAYHFLIRFVTVAIANGTKIFFDGITFSCSFFSSFFFKCDLLAYHAAITQFNFLRIYLNSAKNLTLRFDRFGIVKFWKVIHLY